MQQSRPHNYRKQSLKKLWKGYDEWGPYWKEDQLRGMDLQAVQKEIDEQLADAEAEHQEHG